MTFRVERVIEADQGYFEFRVNWTGDALLAMSTEQMAQFKDAMATMERLERALEAGQGKDDLAVGARVRCDLAGLHIPGTALSETGWLEAFRDDWCHVWLDSSGVVLQVPIERVTRIV